MTVRSVRNNNPGNINKGQPWQGLMPASRMNADQRAEDRFAVFESPAYGFRAMVVILRTYERERGFQTVRQFVGRWAPPSENNTDAYANQVAKAINVLPDQKISLRDYATLFGIVKAMTTHETGGWYGFWKDEDLAAGIHLAAQ